MAASRKLQGEIDKCLKKVTEGVETFNDIWNKVHNANNTNQKEKYEADLKKEIKKLQRLRDQIKSWLASGEIKDKSALLENRKLIETQMERFKVVERETKTKAYSKEGLGAAQNKDPAQKEKDDWNKWLNEAINVLSIQIDKFESDIDTTLATGKKKKVDKERAERVDNFRFWIGRHQFHIKKLEILMRMFNNESLDAVTLQRLREDVDYYVESNQEPDFIENDALYEDIDIEDLDYSTQEILGAGASVTGAPDESTPSPTLCGTSPAPPTPSTTPLSTTIPSTIAPPPSTNNGSGQDHQQHNNKENVKRNKEDSRTPVKPSIVRTNAPTPTSLLLKNTPSKPVADISNHNSLTNHVGASQTPKPSTNGPILIQNKQPQHLINNTTVNTTTDAEKLKSIAQKKLAEQQQIQHKQLSNHLSSSSTIQQVKTSTNSILPQQLILQQQSSQQNASATTNNHQQNNPNQQQQIQQQTNNTNGTNTTPLPTSIPPSSKGMGEAVVPTMLGVAPLGLIQLSPEDEHQFKRLSASFAHLPQAADSERLRVHFPRQPLQTPSYFPQAPAPLSDTVEFYQRLSTETLFFIFYYMEGTKAQYLAAKALKKQSWRFHTKHMMWFQRHEEPKAITDEYEQGTYIFFDYDNWGQRKKENFTFEYRYLEDRDLN